MFGRDKKLQKEVVQLSNIFSNKLNDLIDSFNSKNIINNCLRKNAISFQLLAIEKTQFASHFKIEKRLIGKSRVAGHS